MTEDEFTDEPLEKRVCGNCKLRNEKSLCGIDKRKRGDIEIACFRLGKKVNFEDRGFSGEKIPKIHTNYAKIENLARRDTKLSGWKKKRKKGEKGVRNKYPAYETGVVVATKPELEYSVWVKINGLDDIRQFKPSHLETETKEKE